MTSAVLEMFQAFSRSFSTRNFRSADSLNSRRVPGRHVIAGPAFTASALAATFAGSVRTTSRRSSTSIVSPGVMIKQALDGVAQLADVALPARSLHELERRRRETLRAPVVLAAEEIDEVAHERGDVLPPVAQRRHANRNDAETEIEVLAEVPLLDLGFQVLVRRRDDADVHLDRARGAETLDFPLLQHPQHLGLRLGAHVADFVEEDRAAVGLLELADLLLRRAGERSLFVAEELGLDQLFRNRGAVDLHEAVAAAQTVAMDGARDQFLAGAAFAQQQDRRVGRRRALDRVPDLRRAGLSPTIWCRASTARFSDRFSSRSRVWSSALRMVTRTRSLASGFSMKSNAPSLVASTAVLTVPWPEMMTTGSASFVCRIFCSASRPSMPPILMSRKTRSGGSRSTSATPSGPLDGLLHVVALVLEDHPDRPADLRLVVND